MFKPADLTFYIIYNSYYKHGSYQNDMPAFTVFFIFAIAFFCQLFFLRVVFRIIDNPYHRTLGMSRMEIYALSLLSALIIYFLDYYKKRNLLIYEGYKNNLFANSSLGKFVGWAFMGLSILSPFIFLLIRNKIYFGHWV